MSALLQNGIETLLFECDFLWIKNPLEVFNSYRSKYDIVFIGNYKLPNNHLPISKDKIDHFRKAIAISTFCHFL
jgi:hypothetical protein